MIFVTIGTQGPFDRLIQAVDKAAEMFEDTIIAQISKGGNYTARNLVTSEFMPFNEFNEHFSKARLIVSHAGMGTIINALVENKPILVLPRLAKFGEQRNDHQWATAKEFEKLRYVYTAYDEGELYDKLVAFATSKLQPLHQIGKFASSELIESLRENISSDKSVLKDLSFQ